MDICGEGSMISPERIRCEKKQEQNNKELRSNDRVVDPEMSGVKVDFSVMFLYESTVSCICHEVLSTHA